MISREVESLVNIFIFSGWLGDIRCPKVFACTGRDIDMCQVLLVAVSDTCVSKADIAPVYGPVTSPVASEVSYDPSPVVGTKRADRFLLVAFGRDAGVETLFVYWGWTFSCGVRGDGDCCCAANQQ